MRYYVTKINGFVCVTEFIPNSEYFEINTLPDIPNEPERYKVMLMANFDTKEVWYEFIKDDSIVEQLDRIEELQLNATITNEYVACLLELGI